MKKFLFISSCLFIFVGANVFADTVILKNGDHLTGTVVSISGDKLELETSYADTISIKISEIEMIRTERSDLPNIESIPVIVEKPSDDVKEELPPQEPSEALKPEETEDESPGKWSGTADVGASLRSGATDSVNANWGVEVIRSWTVNTLTLSLKGGYGEVDSKVNERNVMGKVKFQHNFTPKLYGFASTSAKHDPSNSLEQRLEVETGIGYQFIENEKRSLAFDVGLNYTHEKWNKYSITELAKAKSEVIPISFSEVQRFVLELNPMPWSILDLAYNLNKYEDFVDRGVEQDTSNSDGISALLGLRYKQILFKKATLSEDLRVLPSITDFGEYRATSILAFETPLSDKLNMRLSLETEYTSETADKDDQLENKLILGLRYKF